MCMRQFARFLFIVLAAICGGNGCNKSVAEDKKPETTASRATLPQAASSSSPVSQTAARIHWVGIKRLAPETNATSFMEVWNMPETQKLKTQTLEKLSLAPWG